MVAMVIDWVVAMQVADSGRRDTMAMVMFAASLTIYHDGGKA